MPHERTASRRTLPVWGRRLRRALVAFGLALLVVFWGDGASWADDATDHFKVVTPGWSLSPAPGGNSWSGGTVSFPVGTGGTIAIDYKCSAPNSTVLVATTANLGIAGGISTSGSPNESAQGSKTFAFAGGAAAPCPAGTYFSWWRVAIGGVTKIEWYRDQSFDTSTEPSGVSCSTALGSGSKVSLFNGRLTVVLNWLVSTRPGPLKVYVPVPAAGAVGVIAGYVTPSLTATEDYWVGSTASEIGAGNATARVIVTTGTYAGCALNLGLVTTYEVTEPEPSEDSGSSCSFVDIPCQLKAAVEWAFVPSDGTADMWSELGDDLGDKVPFVWMVGTVEYAQDFAECPDCDYDEMIRLPYPRGLMGEGGEGTDYVSILPADNSLVDWCRDHRTLLSAITWLSVLIPIAAFVYFRLLPVVGKGE